MCTRVLYSALAAAWLLVLPASQEARADSLEICQPRDDRAEIDGLTAFFKKNLPEHAHQGFSRQIAAQALDKAKTFLEQKVLDKGTELCAAHLQLAEDIKQAAAAPAACAGPMVASLLDAYTVKVAGAYEENRQALGALRDEHVKNIKLKLFEIAKGSTTGVEGTYQGYPLTSAPQAVRFDWIKQEASKLGAEAHAAWGDTNPQANPLITKNLVIAREAVRAKRERDAARARYRTDGKVPAQCRGP